MGKVHEISVEQAKKMIEEGALLIDVREPAEHRSQKIPRSVNLPMSDISIEKVRAHRPAGQKVIMHCKGGIRSGKACEKIAEASDFDVYTVAGGIDAWQAKGFNVEKSEKQILPLDRQVQLVISLMILAGLMIYYFSGSSAGLLLPLIAGLGLLSAGLTGWCGMAKVLTRMPWNK